MSWNYRVVRLVQLDHSTYYELREAYYDDPNATQPHSITASAAHPGGDTLLELRKDVALMFAAFDKPPLDERVFSPAQRVEDAVAGNSDRS